MKPPKSQNAQILSYLKAGNKLTSLEALQLFGCFRLSGRVFDLKQQGHRIKTEVMILENGKRLANYSMKRK